MISAGGWDAVYVLVHDGLFGLETGAGVSNARFLNCLVRLGFGERLNVGAIETASFARDVSSPHHRRMRALIEGAGGRIFTMPNGTGGRDRYDGVRESRRTADQAAHRLEAERPGTSGRRTLVISFGVPFVHLIGRLAGAGDLVHVHVPRSTAALYAPANRARRRLEDESFEDARAPNTFVGAINDFMRRHLQEAYGVDAANLIDLRNGVLPELPEPGSQPGQASPGAELHALRARLPLPRGERFVLAYGRAVPQKGFDVLIEALARCRGSFRGVLIATEAGGDGAYLGRLRTAWRAMGIRGSLVTEFDLQLPRLLRRCPELMAVVVPSRAAAFGSIPAECFVDAACRAPVIAARTGGLAEQVRHGETGFTFQPGDAHALADCIRRCAALSPEERRKLKRNAARTAAERYDYLANVREFMAELPRRLVHTRAMR